MKEYRLFLDFGMWHNGIPDEIKRDERIQFLVDVLAFLWTNSIDDITFLSRPEWAPHSVPIMRLIHQELMERINKYMPARPGEYIIKDEIGKIIDEIEAGGEALFWEKREVAESEER